MKFSIISDIHARHPEGPSYKLLLSFLNNEKVLQGDHIFFLGDIFDAMVGGYNQYLDKYNEFFNSIEHLITKGMTIHYVEGNHDFHLERLFLKFIESKKINRNLFHLHKKGFTHEVRGVKFYFSHGDDIQLGNLNYKAYKYFITMPILGTIVENFIPYSTLNLIGKWAARTSRRRNQSYYTCDELRKKIKLNFRKAAEKKWKKDHHDYIICGHCHIQDFYKSPNGFHYLNNGHALESKTFIYIDINAKNTPPLFLPIEDEEGEGGQRPRAM